MSKFFAPGWIASSKVARVQTTASPSYPISAPTAMTGMIRRRAAEAPNPTVPGAMSESPGYRHFAHRSSESNSVRDERIARIPPLRSLQQRIELRESAVIELGCGP